MTNVLYISYDGMTDNLGQSQVIPYLAGLSKLGYSFTILSCEKQENYTQNKKKIAKLLSSHNINWHPIPYTATPPVLSTIKDILRLHKEAKKLDKERGFKIVHCRSYISAMIGLKMQAKFGIKFIFDMRGFWPDERIDGKIWNLTNPIFRIIYNYFKRQELKYLSKADYTICLTNNGKQEIHSWTNIPKQPVPIKVIPCCADFNHFQNSVSVESTSEKIRTSLKIDKDDFVLSYLGSVGTWYMLDEMLDFFAILLQQNPKAKFLFITADNPKEIFQNAEKKNISTDTIIVEKSSREDVPAYIKLSNVSIFFIKPAYSKKASSPTKMGEIMGMGVPIVCNDNVGDVGEIIQNSSAGWLVNRFEKDEYRNIINKFATSLPVDKENLRLDAIKYYSLEKGIENYAWVYKTVLGL